MYRVILVLAIALPVFAQREIPLMYPKLLQPMNGNGLAITNLAYVTIVGTEVNSNWLATVAAYGPRLELVEAATTRWETAYDWGDHAAAGYGARENGVFTNSVFDGGAVATNGTLRAYAESVNAIEATSSSGDAVVGESTTRYGVHGRSVSHYGVYGYTQSGYGAVAGYSQLGYGVLGVSDNNYGGYFSSGPGWGAATAIVAEAGNDLLQPGLYTRNSVYAHGGFFTTAKVGGDTVIGAGAVTSTVQALLGESGYVPYVDAAFDLVLGERTVSAAKGLFGGATDNGVDSLLLAGSLGLSPSLAPWADSEGSLYYDSELHAMRYYNGNSWVTLTAAEGGGGGVPYTGATDNLDLGTHRLLVGNASDNGEDALIVGGTSGEAGIMSRRYYVYDPSLGGRNGGFGFDAYGLPILELVLNAGQFNTSAHPVDYNQAGAMFRLDTRENFNFFKVFYKAPFWDEGQSAWNHEERMCFSIGPSGRTYLGCGWDEQEPNIQANQSPADPNATLIVRGGISSGSDAAQGTLTLKAGDTPPSPQPGMIYFNSNDSHFYGYNGSSWVQLDNN